MGAFRHHSLQYLDYENTSQLQVLEIHSFLRSYLAYMEIWTPVVGETLLYGLEVLCVYCLYRPNVYVDKMKELVESLFADGHYNLCNSDFAQ